MYGRISTNAGDMKQTEFVHAGSECYWNLVVLRRSHSHPSRRLKRRQFVEVAIVPRHHRAGFIIKMPSRVVRLKPDRTVHTEFKARLINSKFFFRRRVTREKTDQDRCCAFPFRSLVDFKIDRPGCTGLDSLGAAVNDTTETGGP